MGKLVKQISQSQLAEWGCDPESKIEYYDGKILVIDDPDTEDPFPVAAKAGVSALFAIAIFTHAPFVAATFALYSACKVIGTVRGLYGGDSDLANRIARDLGLSDDVGDSVGGAPVQAAQAAQAIAEGWAPMPPEPTGERQPIGANTRLNAVNASAQTVARKPKGAIDALLESPFLSRSMFGAQRTGKTYLAACASRRLKEERGTAIFHINLMSYGTEDDGYWAHATRSVRADLTMMDSKESIPFVMDAIKTVREFIDTPNSVLIVDEWAWLAAKQNIHAPILAKLLKELVNQIASLSSAGTKRQRGLWLIAPTFVAGEMVQEGKAAKSLQLVYVTIHPDRSVDWNGNRIGFSEELFEQVKFNFPIEMPNSMSLPDEDRVVYIDRQWMGTGELSIPDQRSRLNNLFKTPESQSIALLESKLQERYALVAQRGKPQDVALATAVLEDSQGMSQRDAIALMIGDTPIATIAKGTGIPESEIKAIYEWVKSNG